MNPYREADNKLVASFDYDPFGKVISATGEMADQIPFRYRGYYYDVNTGFYYLNSRYYDPQTCRFINADSYVSTGQNFAGYNMFAYCNNNPVMLYDKIGTRCVPMEDLGPKFPDISVYDYSGGKVYIALPDYIEDASSNMKDGDALIVDKRYPKTEGRFDPEDINPNMQVRESYKITDSDVQAEIFQIMLKYNREYPCVNKWDRTEEVVLIE